MSLQLTHYSTDFKEKRFPLILISDRVASPANIGSLFRLADAFNIEKFLLCGPELNIRTPRIEKTARATVDKVAFEQLKNPMEACIYYKQQGYAILALEITEKSISLGGVDFRQFDKVVLVVGNEISGIDQNILDIADKQLHIDMFGKNSSMNVSHSAGIALYEITKSLPSFQ